jgi:hypothetical protein
MASSLARCGDTDVVKQVMLECPSASARSHHLTQTGHNDHTAQNPVFPATPTALWPKCLVSLTGEHHCRGCNTAAPSAAPAPRSEESDGGHCRRRSSLAAGEQCADVRPVGDVRGQPCHHQHTGCVGTAEGWQGGDVCSSAAQPIAHSRVTPACLPSTHHAAAVVADAAAKIAASMASTQQQGPYWDAGAHVRS